LEKIRAVLDTNVLVGKNRRPLLAAAGLGIFELILSPFILKEVGEVLTEDFKVPEKSLDSKLHMKYSSKRQLC